MCAGDGNTPLKTFKIEMEEEREFGSSKNINGVCDGVGVLVSYVLNRRGGCHGGSSKTQLPAGIDSIVVTGTLEARALV